MDQPHPFDDRRKPRQLLADEAARLRRAFRIFPLIVGFIVGGVAPFLFFIGERAEVIAEIEALADHSSREVSRLAVTNPGVWMYMTDRVADVLDRRPSSSVTKRQTVITSAGLPVVATGKPCEVFCYSAASDVTDGSAVVGQVRVEGTFRSSLRVLFIVLLAGSVLGTIVYESLHRLPLRVIDDALGQIDALAAKLQTVIAGLETEVAARTEESERARLAAEKANQAKTLFLAQTSHALRTPLNAILGFSDIIRLELLGRLYNRTYLGYVNDIYTAGRSLLELLNDILDISRIESGEIVLDEGIIDVPKLMDFCATLFRAEAAKKALDISFTVPGDIPFLIGDEHRVRQILVNLISNATKFTLPGGKVSVKVSAGSEGLAFAIADTGIGIAPGEIEAALAPFGRTADAAKRGFAGAGLGLSLAKQLAEQHGGRLRLVSEVDCGTTATVVFPSERVFVPRPLAEPAPDRP